MASPCAYDLSENIFGPGKIVSFTPDCFVRIVSFADLDTRETIQKGEPYAGLARPKMPISTGGRVQGVIHDKDKEALGRTITYTLQKEILSCSVSHQKSGPVASMSLTVKSTIDWKSAIGQGDHVCVWMKRSHIDLQTLPREQRDALCGSGVESGLKFYGTIRSVMRNFSVGEDGKKSITYSISAAGWGDFLNRDVYFNEYMYESFINNPALFGAIQTSGLDPEKLPKNDKNLSPDQIVECVVNTFLSVPNSTFALVTGNDAIRGINRPVKLPQEVARVFSAEVTSSNGDIILGDILRKQFGILEYDPTSLALDGIAEAQGNDVTLRPFPKNLSGGIPYLPPGLGSNQPLWGIMTAFADLAINELFVDLKPTSQGLLRPTIVHRQIPFTSSPMGDALRGQAKTVQFSRFIDLPRICIDNRSILAESIGYTADGGYNFIQVAPNFQQSVPIMDPASAFAKGNWAMDMGSIRRHGLKTAFLGTSFSVRGNEISAEERLNYLTSDHAAKLAGVLPDWWLGHGLYDTGSITIYGVEEPLSVGDNLLVRRPNGYADELYHIEGYTHSFSVSNGKRRFRTSLTVTRGQTVDEVPLYKSERGHPDWPDLSGKYDMSTNSDTEMTIIESDTGQPALDVIEADSIPANPNAVADVV